MTAKRFAVTIGIGGRAHGRDTARSWLLGATLPNFLRLSSASRYPDQAVVYYSFNLRHLRFQGFNDRIRVRTRFSDALLLTLVFGLLPAMLWAEHSIDEDRVLRVQDGPAARQYPVTELIDAIGLDELRVAADAHFGQGRVFAGFALRTLLSHVGLGDAQELLLGGCPRMGVATGTAILFVEDVEEPDCLA